MYYPGDTCRIVKKIKLFVCEPKSSTQDCVEEVECPPADNLCPKQPEDECIDTSNNNENKLLPPPIFDVRVDEFPNKCIGEGLPKNCAEATVCTQRSGIYKILVPSYSYEPFYVECDAETECGDWIVIQRRQDGSIDFFRNWVEYENGFGDVEGEYFIGLKKLHALTNFDGPQELLILMEDVNNTNAFAKYDSFAISNAAEMYKLRKLGRYTGTAGNSLAHHVGMHFSTTDTNTAESNCGEFYIGGWWHNKCHESLVFGSNLNGKYDDNRYGKGLIWETYNGLTCSLKYVKMMIRRRRF
ncbi:hypothetical protein DOY81_002269 [Sarcophaga bullata]|nr:hypothetical protein DOY81_002269 [Sarcophaga bullata]